MAFLQDLRSALLTVTSEYNTTKAMGGDLSEIGTKLHALSEIWAYIKGGTWAETSEQCHRTLVLLTKDRQTAIKELNLTSANHANTLLWRANTRLEKKFGEDLIIRILSGDIEESMTAFRRASGTLLSEGTFLSEAFAALPDDDGSVPFRLQDCMNEVKFLAFYSKAYLEKRLAALDTQKLAYLVYLLNSYNEALIPEQNALYRVLTGEASASSLEGIVNPLNPVYDEGSV